MPTSKLTTPTTSGTHSGWEGTHGRANAFVVPLDDVEVGVAAVVVQSGRDALLTLVKMKGLAC